LINLDEGTRLAGIEKVLESDDEAGAVAGGATDGDAEAKDSPEAE
jgi:hypothetical protein